MCEVWSKKTVSNLLTIVAAVAMAIFTIYMFYPGVINADSASQLLQARLFKFADWHPPMMSLVWFLLNHVHDGIETMLIFHNLVFWSALTLFVFWVFPEANLYRILLLLFFGFFPTVLAELGMIFKDTGMAVSLFLVSVLFLYAENATTKTKFLVLSIAVIFLFYGFAVRLNSLPAVAVLCVWLGEIISKKSFFKGMLFGIGLLLVLFMSNHLITENILRPVKTYPFQQVQLHDLAAISLAENKPIFPEYILKAPAFSMGKLRQSYMPANVGELVFGDDKALLLTDNTEEIRSLNKIWWQTIYKYPWDYLRHRAHVFAYMVYSCMAFWDDVCRISFSSSHYQPGFIYRLYCSLTLDGPLQFLFHGWIYLANSIIVGAVALRFRRKFPDFRAIMYVTASGLLYVICAFFYAPACEFRYFYWEVIASLMAFFLLVKNIFKSNLSSP